MNNRTNLLLIILFLILGIGFFVVVGTHKTQEFSVSYAAQKPSPAPLNIIDPVTSPDGKYSVLLKQIASSTNTNWSIILTDSQSVNKNIFSENLPSGIRLSVPKNTFSPDNKYIFIKEDANDITRYLVIDEGKTIDVANLFSQNYPNYKITDVTGWAAPTLLILNTNNTNGSIGPSFWFDVPSKSFIQLSERFN